MAAKKKTPVVSQPIVWTKADPKALAQFDPRTKQCTMNCGPHRDDPRSPEERKFLCGDCWPIDPKEIHTEKSK